MSDTKQTVEELKDRIRILEAENSMLVEGAEDFLLLGSISEAVHAESDIETMINTVLEKIALLKGIDLVAICRAGDGGWRIDHSYDSHAGSTCKGMHIQHLDSGKAAGDGVLVLSGADCQALLGPDCPAVSECLLIPYQVEMFGSGYLLLGVAEKSRGFLEPYRNLFHRILEILMMNVSNRLLFQKYQVANSALEKELTAQTKALATSEERFRTVIEQASEGFFLLDATGRFLEVNLSASKLLGYSKDELQQMRMGEIDDSLKQENFKTFLAGFNSSNYQQFCSFHRHKDGHNIPVESNVSRVKFGEDFYYLALVRDLSRQLEAAELQKKFDLLLDNVPDIVCMANQEGTISYLNRAAKLLFGIDDCGPKSISITDLLPPGCSQQQIERIASAMYSGVWVGESQVLAANQEIIPTLQTIVAPKNQLGAVENIFFIQRDLRDLRRLEEQFVQAQKMEAVGTLVGGIAHDFNNLLAGIMGNVFLLLSGTENSSQKERLKTVQQMCQNAADLVSQLLVFARKDKVSIAPLNLNRFMTEFGQMYQVLVPENIRFEIGPIDDELSIMTDLNQFQQIMVNLLTNARDALEGYDNPVIGVSIEKFDADESFLLEHPSLKQAQLVRISVIDNGCGITREVQSKIFDPFFTSKEVNKGTGLGLAMVYGAVKRQQGEIQVISDAGQGTIIRLYLPRVPSTGAPAGVEMLAEGIIYGQGELLILADDDEFVRESHKDALIQLGYRVLSAADGQQAYDMFLDCPQVAMVICDVVMPNLDGLVAGRMIREINADLPLLYLSGYTDKDESHDRLPAGAEILKKPASIELLSQKVARLLHPR